MLTSPNEANIIRQITRDCSDALKLFLVTLVLAAVRKFEEHIWSLFLDLETIPVDRGNSRHFDPVPI